MAYTIVYIIYDGSNTVVRRRHFVRSSLVFDMRLDDMSFWVGHSFSVGVGGGSLRSEIRAMKTGPTVTPKLSWFATLESGICAVRELKIVPTIWRINMVTV